MRGEERGGGRVLLSPRAPSPPILRHAAAKPLRLFLRHRAASPHDASPRCQGVPMFAQEASGRGYFRSRTGGNCQPPPPPSRGGALDTRILSHVGGKGRQRGDNGHPCMEIP